MNNQISTLLTLLVVIAGTQPLCAQDYPFSRVFTDQRERLQLDQLRSTQTIEPEPMTQQPEQEGREELAPGTRITYSGALVSRKKGASNQTTATSSTISWVDGRSSLSGGKSPPAHQVDPGTSHVLSAQFETRGVEATLKPGQVWLTDQQRILESWEPLPAPAPDAELPSEDTSQ